MHGDFKNRCIASKNQDWQLEAVITLHRLVSCLPTQHWVSGYGLRICWMQNNLDGDFRNCCEFWSRLRGSDSWKPLYLTPVGVLLTTTPTAASWESTWIPLPHHQEGSLLLKPCQFEACTQYVWFKLCFGLIWAVTWWVGDGPKITEDSSALKRLKHIGAPYAGQEFGPQTLLC